MLPVRDHDGEITAQAMMLTTIPLIPLALSATALGLAGIWSAGVGLAAGAYFAWRSHGFYRLRDDRSARRVFLASISYLPIVLAAMTLDRGPSSIPALFRGRSGMTVESAPEANRP
jgi:protoheme IX farnesyltransferase